MINKSGLVTDFLKIVLPNRKENPIKAVLDGIFQVMYLSEAVKKKSLDNASFLILMTLPNYSLV